MIDVRHWATQNLDKFIQINAHHWWLNKTQLSLTLSGREKRTHHSCPNNTLNPTEQETTLNITLETHSINTLSHLYFSSGFPVWRRSSFPRVFVSAAERAQNTLQNISLIPRTHKLEISEKEVEQSVWPVMQRSDRRRIYQLSKPVTRSSSSCIQMNRNESPRKPLNPASEEIEVYLNDEEMRIEKKLGRQRMIFFTLFYRVFSLDYFICKRDLWLDSFFPRSLILFAVVEKSMIRMSFVCMITLLYVLSALSWMCLKFSLEMSRLVLICRKKLIEFTFPSEVDERSLWDKWDLLSFLISFLLMIIFFIIFFLSSRIKSKVTEKSLKRSKDVLMLSLFYPWITQQTLRWHQQPLIHSLQTWIKIITGLWPILAWLPKRPLTTWFQWIRLRLECPSSVSWEVMFLPLVRRPSNPWMSDKSNSNSSRFRFLLRCSRQRLWTCLLQFLLPFLLQILPLSIQFLFTLTLSLLMNSRHSRTFIQTTQVLLRLKSLFKLLMDQTTLPTA